MEEKIKKENLVLIKQLLKSLLPEIDKTFQYMEKHGGWLNLKDELTDIVNKLNIADWAKYYETPHVLKTFPALIDYDVEEIKELSKTPTVSRNRLLKEFAEEFSKNEFRYPNPKALEQFRCDFESATNDEQQDITKSVTFMYLSFLTSLFNYLALMLHGKPISTLVREAKNGNDNSLCEAVHIDRTVLFLPFVQKRLLKAQLGNDSYFLSKLGRRISTPILSGKIRYRKLYLAFAILEDEGWLDMPREQLLDLLNEVGVYGKEHGNEDVNYLNKRLNEYKKKNMQLNYF